MNTDDSLGGRVSTAVVNRAHAQQAISEFLSRQSGVRPRSWLERVLGLSPLGDHSAPWFWSAVGMIEVGATLDGLSPEFQVFHGMPGPPRAEGEPSGIAHLVIGPPGVFTVTAHNHARENVWADRRDFVVNGHRLPYIRWAEADVGFAERMLSVATDSRVTVSAVIAVIDPAALTVRGLPRDVAVVRSASLSSWFDARQPVLDANRVEFLSAAAGDPATWASFTDDAEARTGAEHTRFDELRREVGAARVVRSLWLIGLAAIIGSALLAWGTMQLMANGG